MNTFTRMSSKGQVVIPNELRSALDWVPGTELEVVRRPGGVFLKTVSAARPKISWDEFRHRVSPHKGPPLTLDEMDAAVERLAARQL